MPKIGDIITKHYHELIKLATASDIPVYNSLMVEDILQNCFLTALNKYKETDISEENGLNYLKKTILNEVKFSYRRKKNDRLLLVENLLVHDKVDENGGE